jgi:lysophospholipase L1-like esterase
MLSKNRVYLFAGDSLTEGVYGASYVERVRAALPRGERGLQAEVVNAGRSGETVASLLQRVEGLAERHRPTWLILAVGCNDVWLPWLSDHSLGWRLWVEIHRLRTGQGPTTDLDQFAASYRALIDLARRAGARVLACTTSPVGEQLSSPVNGRVARLNGVIKHVAADRQVPVADVWQAFIEDLALLPRRSAYVSAEWLFAWLDRRRYGATSADEMAEARRLHLTFDGVHLNSRGADLWASVVLEALARAESREGGLRPGPNQAGVQPPDRSPIERTGPAQERQTILGQLGAHGAELPALVRNLDLTCFQRGMLPICCSPGREARARDVGLLLAAAYDHLASLTGVCPPVYVALLSSVHRSQSPCPAAHPAPCSVWDGHGGTLFVADAYELSFLRSLHLPEAVAAWTSWPRDLAEVGDLARATALADLLAVEELARLFLHELRVAPTDPELARLMAAYLTLLVLRGSRSQGSGRMAALWTVWGQTLADAGLVEGQIRVQARALYAEHGESLVAWFSGSSPLTREAVKVTPVQPS